MRELVLSRGKVAIVDDEDFEWLSQWKWSFAINGYAVSRTKGQFVLLHRVILGCVGRNDFADHINGDRLDNRRSNLRRATPLTNTFNKKKENKNTSGYKGVSWNKRTGKWDGQIMLHRKRYHLGSFNDPALAHEAYKAKAKELFGEFARFE